MAKRTRAALLLAVLLTVSPLHLAAGTTGETPLQRATAWLATATPAPAPGDEALVFTLLRARVWRADDEPVQDYIRETLVLLEDGGAATQPLAECAMQAIALSAAGIQLDAVVPSLLLALCDANALAAEGYAAQLPALVLFGSLGVQVPEGVLFSPTGVARAVAGHQNPDGGFGEDGSDAYTTALVMTALAGYAERGDINTALLQAQLWLQDSINEYGGLNDADGIEDPAATALAMLQLDAMGYSPEYLVYQGGSLSGYLATFQIPDGSFAPPGSDAPEYGLTVLATAALAAQWRFASGHSAFLGLEDVVLQDPAGLMPQTVALPQPEEGWRAALVVTCAVFALALFLFVFLRIRRRRL